MSVVIILRQFVNFRKAFGIDNAAELVQGRHLMRSFTTSVTPIRRHCSKSWYLQNPAGKLTNVNPLRLVDDISHMANDSMKNTGFSKGLSFGVKAYIWTDSDINFD